MKTCFKCNQAKPLSDFYKHNRMADGHLNKCKECTKCEVKSRRMDDVIGEKIRAYDRNRGNRQTAESIRNYREKYPNKYKSHCIVNNAIKNKKLFKEPCCVCGATENIHAHHDDYLKPLNIRWMCAMCHHRWHSLHGSGLNPF